MIHRSVPRQRELAAVKTRSVSLFWSRALAPVGSNQNAKW